MELTPSLKWFQSYLTGRKQITCVNGTLSDYRSMLDGVPGGGGRGVAT